MYFNWEFGDNSPRNSHDQDMMHWVTQQANKNYVENSLFTFISIFLWDIHLQSIVKFWIISMTISITVY